MAKTEVLVLFLIIISGVSGYYLGGINGYKNGYSIGLVEGRTLGYLEGKKDGYTLGYTDGTKNGYNTGFDKGNDTGFYLGFKKGYDDGVNGKIIPITDEAKTIIKIGGMITINNIPLNELKSKNLNCYGGSNPYLWDLWKPNGLIQYYFIEDLSSEKADNYRDVIVGISLLYPVPEENRDYPTGTYRGTSELNVCVFTFCEGADAKLIKCGDALVSDYPGVPGRFENDVWIPVGVTSDLYPGFKYDLKYIPLTDLGISPP